MYASLLKIQQELNAPKSQYNKFGKYNYRSLEDINTAVKPLLADTGCVFMTEDELVQIGDRFYIKATAKLAHIESGETISNTAYAREDEMKKGMDGSQITGTASSYARKYAANGLFAIDDTKDADTDGYREQTQNNRAPKTQAVACPKCNEEVKPIKLKDGTTKTAQEVLDGMGMCADCWAKRE